MPEWFDDDELWRVLQPALFTSDIIARAPAQVDAVIKLLDLQPGAAVLDLPCGIGRHSVQLALRGFRVTAVDRTRHYLDQAAAAVEAAGLEAQTVLDDMRTFRRNGEFDAVLNLWTSFGYSSDPADDLRTLANFYASLKPGGRLIIELNGREMLARQFRERDWRRLEDGTLWLEERQLIEDWSSVQNHWLLIRDGEVREFRFALRLFTASDLKSLAASAGFVDIRCFGSLAGTPYDHKAERLVLVASRPA